MKLQFFSDYSIIILSMKKVKHILVIFLHSFVPQDIYYPKLLHTRFQFSLRYFVIILALFAFIFTGVVLYQLTPSKLSSYKNSIISSLTLFPSDATVKIAHGLLESNQNKPIFLWIYHQDQPLFVFMVYSNDVITSASIPSPLVFLGADKMQISYRGMSFVQPYTQSWNVFISKERIQTLIDVINSVFPSFVVFLYLFLIITLPLAYAILATFFVFVSSVLVFGLLRTFIPHIHNKKCMQAGIHGTHIPLIITILLFMLFPSSSNVLIVAAALIFVFTLVSTYEMYSKEISHLKGL